MSVHCHSNSCLNSLLYFASKLGHSNSLSQDQILLEFCLPQPVNLGMFLNLFGLLTSLMAYKRTHHHSAVNSQ